MNLQKSYIGYQIIDLKSNQAWWFVEMLYNIHYHRAKSILLNQQL